MKVLLAVLLFSLSTLAMARDELPLNEQDFVDAIKTMNISKIVELIGAPGKADEIKDDQTGETIGQVWHYYFLNTSAEGEYYPTTELDIVDDHVATVVFMNDNDDNAIQSSALPPGSGSP